MENCQAVAGYLPAEEDSARDWQQTLKDSGFDVDVSPGDVSCFDSCASMVSAVEDRFGPIEFLVNCAGITADRMLRNMQLREWEDVITTNLSGVFNVTRHIVDSMVERRFGRIVSISSVNGQKGQFGQTNYSAAKAGVHGFTMALAQEVAGRGVTVNTVSPGFIDTEMTMAIPEDIREGIMDQIPLGKMGRPEDIAYAVAFLCHDDASYITGANLAVNGGLYMD